MSEKLWDFQCDTCGKREERWADVLVLPCSAPACCGTMGRLLGGRPAAVPTQRPGRPRLIAMIGFVPVRVVVRGGDA